MTLNKNSNTDSTSCSNGSGTARGKDDSSSSNDDCRTSLQLRELIDRLPQELYDQIYDLTFTAESKIRIYNYGRGYTHTLAPLTVATKHHSQRIVAVNESIPHLLHVDRTSRQKFAESYYGNPNSIFLFSNGLVPVREKPFLRLMKDVRLILWCNSLVLLVYGRKCIAEGAGISAGSIGLISYEDISGLLNKRVGGVEKAVAKPAAVYIDLTI
ncbi:hypothetical protein CBER1_10119 [Cercospora berteroae]|uniref:Uncharacterized protein n=1 Tax=Cercospora berteroae TaxID=357750 RepID=A0A2S6CKE8_9PEZI|nr:hypothetical protein CBER1_10119 [Cercospora berteroae]